MDAAINYVISLWEKLIGVLGSLFVVEDISLLSVIIGVTVIVTVITVVFRSSERGE